MVSFHRLRKLAARKGIDPVKIAAAQTSQDLNRLMLGKIKEDHDQEKKEDKDDNKDKSSGSSK